MPLQTVRIHFDTGPNLEKNTSEYVLASKVAHDFLNHLPPEVSSWVELDGVTVKYNTQGFYREFGMVLNPAPYPKIDLVATHSSQYSESRLVFGHPNERTGGTSNFAEIELDQTVSEAERLVAGLFRGVEYAITQIQKPRMEQTANDMNALLVVCEANNSANQVKKVML